MVDINATLVVQAFNFFIAYLLLRYLLIKPAMQVLRQEDEETAHLQSLSEERTQMLAQTVEEKEEAWKDFQTLFSQEAPHVRRNGIVHSGVEPIKPAGLPQQQELAQLANDLQRVITKKVSHVE